MKSTILPALIVACLSIPFCSSSFAEQDFYQEPYLSLDSFISEVMIRVRDYFPEWADDLRKVTVSTGFRSIRLHASPFDEPLLPKKRFRWNLFRRVKAQEVFRPSKMHLNVIEAVAEEVRNEQCFWEVCGKFKYLWTEERLEQFESLISDRMEHLAAEYELKIQSFHEDRRPPSEFEVDRLLQDYLEIWSLGAILEVESARFLKSFPIKGSHPDRLRERHEPRSLEIKECRIAFMRITDDNYMW